MRVGGLAPTAALRLCLSFALLGLAVVPPSAAGPAPGIAIGTGIRGRVVAMYSPDGRESRAVLATIRLANLEIRATDQIVNQLAGRGDDVFVAVGAPAHIARYVTGGLAVLPGLDEEFLSVPALSTNRSHLAFARDTRRQDSLGRDAGEELWIWDLKSSEGRVSLALPAEHFIVSLAWIDDETLLAQVSGRQGQNPQLWVVRGGKVASRFPASGAWFFHLGDDRIIQVPRGVDARGSVVAVTPHLRAPDGSQRVELTPNWIPLALSPDGAQLLLASITYSESSVAASTLLGLAPLDDPRTVTPIGGVPGGVHMAVWQAEPQSSR